MHCPQFSRRALALGANSIILWALTGLLLSSAMAETTTPAAAGKKTIKSGGFSFLVEPAPSWVVPPAPVAPKPLNAAVYYSLVDEQVRIDGRDLEAYRHAEREVTEPAGLAPAAQVLADFDPTYQKLVFHRLGVWRGGHYIDKLDGKRITLLHRETQLEYRIYDGVVTASIMLDDLRVGDRVEYAYTVRGANPVFDGRFVYSTWAIAQSGPIVYFRLRLLAPADRRIFHRVGPAVAVEEREVGGQRETLFTRRDIPQFTYDPNTPDNALLPDEVQLSEFADWGEVARWGEKLFSATALSTPALRQRAEALAAAGKTPGERLRRALDFVQNEVRYFGLEMGANSHRPAAPGTVLEQRFGDCKDKTSLLIGLLRELGIEAQPVLVSAHYRGQVADILPGPFAFDHAIARVQLDGQTYWLDGTRLKQTGPLVERQAAGFRKGLVLAAGSSALAGLPGYEAEERVAVDETFRISQFAAEPALESRITYYGELAEFLRQTAATQPLSQLETQFSSDYARLYPGSRSTSTLRLEEVPNRNAVTVVQNFAVPKFWTFPDERQLEGTVGLWSLAQATKLPDELTRQKPLRIQLPGIHRHTIAVEYSEDVIRSPNTSHSDDGDGNFAYGVTYETSPRRAQIRAELRLPKENIAVADWQAFSEKIRKTRTRFALTFSAPVLNREQMDRLSKDLRELREALRTDRSDSRSVTEVQVTARARIVVLSAQLEAGRLNPLLRAQTLRQRGIQSDNLGMPEKASADFEEALRLDPNEAKNFAAAAVNAFLRRRDALAIERADSALALSPADPEPNSVRAFAAYFSGNYQAARETLQKTAAASAERQRSYSALWLYLTARRLGEDGVGQASEYLPVAASPAWPFPILQMFAGAGTFDQAMKAARENASDPSRLCELYFYAGEKALLDGDLAQAQQFFRKSVGTGVVEFSEYAMAKRRLDALTK